MIYGHVLPDSFFSHPLTPHPLCRKFYKYHENYSLQVFVFPQFGLSPRWLVKSLFPITSELDNLVRENKYVFLALFMTFDIKSICVLSRFHAPRVLFSCKKSQYS